MKILELVIGPYSNRMVVARFW